MAPARSTALSGFSAPALSILAPLGQYAAITRRTLRMADAPTMLNQVEMQGVAPFRRNLLLQFAVRGFGGDFWANQPETPRHPPDMRIDRKCGPA
jgi:hypothetical protein